MSGKSFFVVLMFVLFGMIVAGGALGETDLTPDNGTTTTTSGAALNYGIFNAEADTSGLAITGGMSSSTCGSVYVVQPGDYLWKIARACGAKVDDLVAFNPDIVDPDLIYPNQKINIVIIPTVPAAPATAVPLPVATATAEPAAVVPAAQDPEVPAAAPASGLRPGGSIPVRVDGFEAFSMVQIGIGRVGDDPQIVNEGITDETGAIGIDVEIPSSARPGERWVVTISSMGEPPFSVKSPEFTIAQ